MKKLKKLEPGTLCIIEAFYKGFSYIVQVENISPWGINGKYKTPHDHKISSKPTGLFPWEEICGDGIRIW
jgi:hypothetical protein